MVKKANNLSLNVKKTGLIIFHPKMSKLDYRVNLNSMGKDLILLVQWNIMEYC